MIDSRFYGEANTFSAGDLAAALVEVCQTQMKEKCPPIEIEGGEATRPLSGVSSLKDAGSDHVAYYHNKSVLKNVDYEEVLKQTKAGAVFVNRENA
ncbi:MAG: hypothetical protein K2X98_00840, partial [Alphaproteobacteria bacterium]|nr:hypothetical protein [Alphaproteobacteria bacterium]